MSHDLSYVSLDTSQSEEAGRELFAPKNLTKGNELNHKSESISPPMGRDCGDLQSRGDELVKSRIHHVLGFMF